MVLNGFCVFDDDVDEYNRVTLDNQVKKNINSSSRHEAADVEGEKKLRYGFAFTAAAAA